MTPVSWPLIPAEIASWVTDANALDVTLTTFPEELARSHARFEQIHPFLDGNGRAGRLVLNLILVRLGYPPAIIYKRDRSDYLRALQRADDGEPGQLGEMLARAILDNLYRFVVPAVAGPARLVPTRSPGDTGHESLGTSSSRSPRTAPSHTRARRPVAELTELGRRVHGGPLPTELIPVRAPAPLVRRSVRRSRGSKRSTTVTSGHTAPGDSPTHSPQRAPSGTCGEQRSHPWIHLRIRRLGVRVPPSALSTTALNASRR